MGILGFPSADEMSSMLGFVTEEDRDKWNREKARSDAQMAERESAKSLSSRAVDPALGFADKSINAQMQGEQIAERERLRQDSEVRYKKTTNYVKEETSFGPKGGDAQFGD